ncbi:RHS repeat-associated core domain-containing protein [Actinoplanes utahensis]|uniref:RHS repeat-associated core domain-containing protein n=1 Tax=Actinoplanes utahensis TaxID=1869 RepID=UPI001F2EAB4F|nr:RHS repeat-associated core domain-containing protein [Actinoplanes utahensis]
MSGLVVPVSAAVAAEPLRQPTPPPVEKLDNDGGPVTTRAWAQKQIQDAPAPAATWPKPVTARIDLTAASTRAATATTRKAKAGDLPIWVADTPEASGTRLSRLDLEVIDRATLPAEWRDSMMLKMTAPQGAAPGKTRLSVDYRGFQKAYGADWASRLRLWQVPRCALTTPTAAACRSVALPSTIDQITGTISATVAVDAAPTATAAASSVAATGSFVALAGAPTGESGDFTATTLAPSSTWSAGGNSGAFSWTYPMQVPPAIGLSPTISLDYSSAAVDGRSEVTNNQPSWIGEGFDYTPGYIERRYVPCYQDSDEKTNPNSTKNSGDLCWRTSNAILHLGGTSSELIFQDGKGWHPRVEDGSKIEKLLGAANGDGGKTVFDGNIGGEGARDGAGEHWRVTDTHGTQYYFGLDDLPGETDPTNSTLTVPVFGNHTGEPCHASTFIDSDCVQAYRWNLDYVTDVRGNTMSYWYGKETNKYAQNTTDSATATYDRASYLTRIDYGTYDRTAAVHGVTERNTNPYAQVVFTPDIRCFTNCGTEAAPTTANWKDTPWDQECKASASTCPRKFSPTFWTAKRLKTVTTRVWDTTVTPAKWQDVDSWTLTHTFSATADTTHTGLWLAQIDRAGLVGGRVDSPPVTFEAISKPNRVLTENTSTENWLRIASIVTETGAHIKVDYSDPDCTAALVASLQPHTNTRRCYPVKVPDNANPGGDVMVTEWWHKYVVTHIAESDLRDDDGHPAPTKNTWYQYVGDAAWHYADDDGLIEANRKTWDQWRGYDEVRTSVGDEADTRTLTITKFLRGMHGDRATPTGGTRPVPVSASVGSETIYDYDQFAGRILEQATYNGVIAKPVAKTIYVPWRSNPTASRTIVDATKYADTVEARYVDTQTTYTATALGTDGSRGWRISSSHDDIDHTYGTVNWSQDNGDISKTGDEKCIWNVYNRNTAKNLTRIISRTVTAALACGKSPASTDDIIADSRTYFDGATSLTTAPAYGSPTKTEELKDWTPETGTVWQVVSQATYDSAGRTRTTTDIKNQVTETTYTPAVGGPLTKTTAKNPLGWTSTVDTNPYWGTITKQTDPNKKIVNDVDYDPVGRVARVWKLGWPRAANPTKPSAQYEYTFAPKRDAYPYIKSQTLNATGNYVTSYQILDALLRPRQTQTLSLGGSGDRVVTDTLYDEFGRAATAYGAHAEPGAPTGVLWWEPEWSVTSVSKTHFDRASRATASVFLSGDGITNLVEKRRTTTAYEGDLTKVTPPQGGTPTTTVTDIQGRVTALRQHTTPTGVNGDHIATSYTYNRKGQQTRVADSDGNEWTSTYDVKGRLDASTDPDKGNVDFVYNDYNELISTTDARGEKLWYKYDALGRKIQVRDDSSSGRLRTAYRYDTYFDDTPGVRGQLTQATRYEYNPAGTPSTYKWQVIRFNERYQPTGVDYVIPAIETGLAGTYSYAYDYSTATGEPTTLSYPAGGGLVTEQLTTHYDASTGMPARLDTSLTGWEGTMATAYFTAYGESTGSDYKMPNGHWAKNRIEYEEDTRRVKRTTVERQTVAGFVSDRSYEYDKVGNITAIEEKPVTGSSEKQCFRTDALGRLSTAWTPKPELSCTTDPTLDNLAGPAPYWQDWTFNDTGSRTTETTHATTVNTIREYTLPTGDGKKTNPAHAVLSMTTTTGEQSTTNHYRYDAAGNTICRPAASTATNDCSTNANSQTLNWDAEGELAAVTADGHTIEASVYDASGERLIRRDANGTTLYLPGQEIRREGSTNTGTRYYSFAGATFASRTASSSITSLTWLFSDHQGTQQISINAGTQAVTTRRQTPYGGERGPKQLWVNNKSFVGGDNDPTGLINIGARRYDVTLGRFISVDPLMDLSDPQQWNPYSYANNSPITSSDPTGLIRLTEDGRGGEVISPNGGGKGTGAPRTVDDSTGSGGSDREVEIDDVSSSDEEVFRKRGYNRKRFTWAGLAEFASRSTDNWVLACIHFYSPQDASPCSGKNPFGPRLSNGEQAVVVAALLGGFVAAPACAILATACVSAAIAVAEGEAAFYTGGAMVGGVTTGAVGIWDLWSSARKAAAAEGSVAKAAESGAAKVAREACSFSGDTEVLLADGSAKPLNEVQVGDEVLASNPETGEHGPRKIEKVWIHNDDLYALTVDGKRLITTEDHPFWNETDKRWEGAEQIDSSDLVLTLTGTEKVDGFDRTVHQYAASYNLTVADIHTYYVLAGDTPVLVHNAGCDEWAAAFVKRSGGEVKTFVGAGGDRFSMGPYRPKGPGTPELGESWFHHTVVLKEGKVYDQWHKDGIGIDEYKQRFDYWEDMDFGF